MTDQPINLREGSVFESAVDLQLPGPVSDWKQSRTYRNQSADFGTSRLGHHWFDGMEDMWITSGGGHNPYTDDGSEYSTHRLRFNARGTVPLVAGTTVSGITPFTVPSDWNITVVDDTNNDVFVVREKFTDRVYIFYDFEGSDSDLHGRLKEITTRQWYANSITGWEFSYDSTSNDYDGRLLQITPPAPQDNISIVFEYNSAAPGGYNDEYAKISSVQVWDGSTLLERVDYTYWDDVPSGPHLADLGHSGCLIQVKVSRRSSNDTTNNLSIKRYTQYRYYPQYSAFNYENNDQGALRAIFDHSALESIVADSSVVSSPEQILELEDDEDVPLMDYATKSFEYFSWNDPGILQGNLYNTPYSGEDTTDVDTKWETNEDLEAKYGGIDYWDTHEIRVRAEHISGNSGCTSCSSGVSGRITREYHYMRINQGAPDYALQYHYWGFGATPDDINEVTMLVVEDTIAYDDEGDPYPLYRKVYGLNDYSRKLREVFFKDPTGAIDDEDPITCWCWAWIYFDADVNNDGDMSDVETDYPHLKHRLAQFRLPSAYDVTSMQQVRWFLDPYDDPNTSDGGSSGWQNDGYCLWDWEAGVTYFYDYDEDVYEYDVDPGLRYGTRIRHGQLDTDPKYISANDWGGDAPGGSANDQPRDRIVASYVYPAASTNRTVTSRIQTRYEYDFYDSADTQLQHKRTLVPKVGYNENGPGTNPSDPDNAEVVVSDEYYDEAGRLRWMKDGEGYVHYYSYSPTTGGLAYSVTDVSTSSLSSEITSGSSGKWLAWSSGVPTGFTRDSNLPNALQIVRKYEFDAQGREILRIDPPVGPSFYRAKHYTAYESSGSLGGVERIISFPYWDDSTDISRLPIEVRELDVHGRLTSTYSLPAGFSNIELAGDVPVGLTGTISASDCVALTRYVYDDPVGRLKEVRRYHDTSGDTAFTHRYSTQYLYDAEGRVGAVIEDVESGKYQVTVILYDKLGRAIERRRGVVSAVPTDYTALAGTSPASGYATLTKTIYDFGGVGDGNVTSIKRFYGTGATQFVENVFHRTYRGDVRGLEIRNNTTDVKPYIVYDLDWLGRTTATAQYTTEPSWSNVLDSGHYNAFIPSNSTARYNRLYTYFDVRGRVYRTDSYPGTSVSQVLRTNNYYDLNSRLVCTGDPYAAHMEYAYDGAGRQYQTRTVLDVESTKYDSNSKFNYRSPLPDPHWLASTTGLSTTSVKSGSMVSGDDKVIEMDHMVYNGAGNVEQEHHFEVNHDDTDGLDLTANDDYVRSSAYTWFDEAHRQTAVANYGSGDTASGQGAWKYAAVPGRPSSVPTSTSATLLLTQHAYNSTGRLETVTDPAGIKTKIFYDDLARRMFVAENQDNFEGPGDEADIGGGTNNDKDRVTKWEYNGLGQVAKLRAYNGSSANYQDTKYLYEYTYDASLVTNTIYPDSSDTNSSGTDQVKVTYNLDGRPATMTDQRDVVHTYTYDTARRLSLDGATTIPSSVYGGASETDAVRSISRTYNDLGEPLKITSYADNSGTGTIQNEIQYNYSYVRALNYIYQSHQGAVNTSTTPATSFNTDVDSVNDGTGTLVFSDGLHRITTYYPVAAGARLEVWHGGNDSVSDRLGRSRYEKLWGGNSLNGDQARTFYYEYNGVNRLAGVSDDANVLYTPNLRHLTYSTPGNYDSYDRFGRTIKQRWHRRSDSATHDQFDCTYDYAGNRLTRDIPSSLYSTDNLDHAYTYDGLHRLKNYQQGTLSGGSITSASRNYEQDWTLDALGNWPTFKERDTDTGSTWDLSQTRYHNVVNEIAGNMGIPIVCTPNWTQPTYDAAGNMTLTPRPTQPTNGFRLAWDAWNRLIRVSDWDDVEITKYEYDGLHKRIRKDAPGTTSDMDYYYNDQWQLLTEVKNGTVEAIYHWHPFYVDALATRMRASDIHFFLHDANFNVTAAVDDSTDAVVERYRYTPYGTPTFMDGSFGSISASAIGNQHLYTGRERDPESGLQLNRHRYYASHLGRWLTRDPIGYEGGSPNLYEYVRSLPTVTADSSGLQYPGYPMPPGWELPPPRPPKPSPPPKPPEEIADTPQECNDAYCGESPASDIANCVCHCCVDLGGTLVIDHQQIPGVPVGNCLFPRTTEGAISAALSIPCIALCLPKGIIKLK